MKIIELIEKYFIDNNYLLNLPIKKFVSIVSNYYHEIESKEYDKLHKTMFKESSKYWNSIINNNINQFEDNIILLDYGCGTGFATKKILTSKLSSRITKVVCYDLSAHMIEECKKNILSISTNNDIEFLFLSGDEGLKRIKNLKYNVVVTNALLHHLLDLEEFFYFLDIILSNEGVYIAGHEPNTNYYNNHQLIKVTKRFQKYKRITSKFSINYILQKLNLKKSGFKNIINDTNNKLLEEKLISKKIANDVLPKLVDIHVPIGIDKVQFWGESGFTPKLITKKYCSGLKEIDFQSYFHIKDYKASENKFWKRKMKDLEKKFPVDGADCIMLFKKV